jgi:hypothetical protein
MPSEKDTCLDKFNDNCAVNVGAVKILAADEAPIDNNTLKHIPAI